MGVNGYAFHNELNVAEHLVIYVRFQVRYLSAQQKQPTNGEENKLISKITNETLRTGIHVLGRKT